MVTRRLATRAAGGLVAAAAFVGVMAVDGGGWDDDSAGLTDLVGVFGFLIAVGVFLARANSLRGHLLNRRRVRRRMIGSVRQRERLRVDVNHASTRTLAELPGIDDALADVVAATRPFQSVEDLGAALDLAAEAVETLRPITAFEP